MAFDIGAFKVSGPLGGANFLSSEDYQAGTKATERIGQMPIRAIQGGMDLRRSMQDITRNDQVIAQGRRQEDDAIAAKKQADGLALFTATRGGFTQQQQPAAPATPTAALPLPQGQPQPQPSAAPAAQAYSVAPTLGQQTPAQVAAQTSLQAGQTPAGVMPPQAPPTAAVMPATTAAAVVAPAVAAQAPVVSRADTLRQNLATAATGAEESDRAILRQLVQSGQMTPETAGAIDTGLKEFRVKTAERAIDAEDKITQIETRDITNREKALSIRAVERDFQNDVKFDVLTAYATGGKAAGTLAAQEAGLNINFDDEAQIKKLDEDARKSPQFKEMQKEIAASKELNTKDLPDGYFRVGKGDPQVFKIENSQPVKVDTAELEQARQRVARAGSTQVSVGSPSNAGGQQVGDPGKLREALGKNDAATLDGVESGNRAASAIIQQMAEIKDLVTDPATGRARADLNLGPGAGIKMLAERWGVKEGDARSRVVAEAVKMRSAEAELTAAGRMKGQGALTDSERGILRRASSGDVNNFTAADWHLYTDAQIKLQRATIDNNNARVDNIQKRNSTVPLDTFKASQPAGPSPTKAAAPDVDKKWGAK